MIKTKHNVFIKCFQWDLGGEYTSNNFCELLIISGTLHQTCIDTPQQKGVAERNLEYTNFFHCMI